MNRRILKYVVLVAGVALGLGITLPALSPPSNCGGNSAALSRCRNCGLLARLEAQDNGELFDATKLSDWGKKDLERIAKPDWLGNASFLFQSGSFAPERDVRLVIAVCDTAFDNIPQPTFWNGYKRTPAHAVAYADGSAGLIPPKEFQKLDLSGFISAKEFIALHSPTSTNASPK